MKNIAVQKAIENQRKEYQQQLRQVKKEAEQYQQRLKTANQKLDVKDSKIEEIKDGNKECFSKESLEIFNSY